MDDRVNRGLIGLLAVLLIALGVLLMQYTTFDMFRSSVPSIDAIMAHWPQLQRAPSLQGVRGEVGGMPLPDGYDLNKLPKAGLVWPCTGAEEGAQLCYLMADFSRSPINEPVDIGVDHKGKYLFLLKNGEAR